MTALLIQGGLTEEQIEERMKCVCSICGHMPCPVCLDCCDHPDCIVWVNAHDPDHSIGRKTHECVFIQGPS